MRILVTGATGFIGRHVCRRLLAAGHEVVGVARRPGPPADASRWVALDFAQATPATWRPALQGVDAVVNAVGIFRESAGQRFEQVHVAGPRVLFEACVAQGVRRVLQVSALGADEAAATGYHRSKKAGDEALLALPLEAAIVQPSLVFGADGASARMFLTWASLPLLPLPAGGRQAVQPVHVDDAAAAIVALLQADLRGVRVALVGPQPFSLAGYLQALRTALGLRAARTLSMPAGWVALAARAGNHLPGALLDTAAWQMLQRGNVAPADAITSLLGHAPRAAAQFVAPEMARAALAQARLGWLLPLLRASIACVWIVTGLVSFGLFPVAQSEALLARAGVPPLLQAPMLYGAALFDLVLGLLTLWPRWRGRRLWLVQAALILFYTAVITMKLPEYWLHPYGPVLKNLPMLVGLLMLAMLERTQR